MGMSASQARLLSITSRLTNNEFRAQTITNSKLRLAEKSQEASSQYMDALNSQQLVFGVYNDKGEYTAQELTPALIYDYQPLKNQYALVNPAGKILVSAQDAKNFEETNSLNEFLERYDLFYTQEVTATLTNIESGMINNQIGNWLNNNGYSSFFDYMTQKDLSVEFNNAVEQNALVANIYNAAITGTDAQDCKEAYLCLLNHFIGFGQLGGDINHGSTWETTTGETVTSKFFFDNGNYNVGIGAFADFPQELIKGTPIRYCDGDDDRNTSGKQNILETARNENRVPSDLEKLKSDYIEIDNGDGTYSYEKKTLLEKALDMYYIIQNQPPNQNQNLDLMMSPADIAEMFKSFIENDLKKPQTPGFTFGAGNNLNNNDIGILQNKLTGNQQLTVKKTIKNAIEDKTKAQWYINLWYMMNGSDTANIVREDEYYDAVKKINLNILTVDNQDKFGSSGCFEVFEDMNLFKSSDWLQFALEHGMVSMHQAQYTNPSANSGKVPELTSKAVTWKSIIYTNASDISAQEDEVAIAIAEVKYKNTITEIENQDKKYDQDLKKLDTEHTALQTEYESIKEVISKNVERSFKAFS